MNHLVNMARQHNVTGSRVQAAENISQGRIRRPCTQLTQQASFWAYKPYFLTVGGELHLMTWKGRRKRIGSGWTFDDIMDHGAYQENKTLWIKWTHSTESTAGSWSAWTYGDPEEDDATKVVFRLVTTALNADGEKDLFQERYGNIEVLDIRYCGGCYT